MLLRCKKTIALSTKVHKQTSAVGTRVDFPEPSCMYDVTRDALKSVGVYKYQVPGTGVWGSVGYVVYLEHLREVLYF